MIDRVVGAVSPLRGLQRQLARNAIARLAARSAYDGAKSARRWHNRATAGGSADADLDADTLAELRERSRDRYRNDGVARAAIDSLTDNVVGTGLRPILALPFRMLGITEDRARALREQATEIWDEWSETCEATMRLSMEEVQAQCFAQVLLNGDVLALPVRQQSRQQPTRYDLKIEMVEGDRLDTPLGSTNPFIRSGVELNDIGEPIAYHIAEQHPGDSLIVGATRASPPRFVRRPAFNGLGQRNVLHVYVQERPGQSRGCPVLAPVLDTLKDRDDYAEAEVVASQVAACASAFIKKADPYTAMLARATDDTKGRAEVHDRARRGRELRQPVAAVDELRAVPARHHARDHRRARAAAGGGAARLPRHDVQPGPRRAAGEPPPIPAPAALVAARAADAALAHAARGGVAAR